MELLVGFFLCLLSVHAATAFDGRLIKHLTEPRPGGIIDRLRNHKLPGTHLGGGLSFGVGSFGLNFGFNKQYTPPGTGVVLPPKEPQVPGVKPEIPDSDGYIPDVKPGFPNIPSNPVVNPYIPAVKPGYWNPNSNPYIPGYPNGNPYIPGYPSGNPYVPGYPSGNPYVPGHPNVNPNVPEHPNVNPHVPEVKPDYPNEKPYLPGGGGHVKPEVPKVKPEKPEVSWEEEKEEKGPYYPPRPNWSKEDKDSSKPELYEEDKNVHSKPESYENEASYPDPDRKDSFPDWEDVGEYDADTDKKAEHFMDGDLIADGLIQPRLKKTRSKRYIESRVFHVPLLFRSNAKPYQVKVQSHLNSLEKEVE